MKFEVIGVFVNTFTADDKYPVRDCGNFNFCIQMQLSEKLKTFSEFFVQFMETRSNFRLFKENDDRHS